MSRSMMSPARFLRGGLLPASRSVRQRGGGVAALLLAVALLASCSSGGGGGDEAAPQTSPPPATPTLTVTPADGAAGIALTEAVVVTSNAPLASVTVARGASAKEKTEPGTLEGTFSADHRTWTSASGLFSDSRYDIQATTAQTAGLTGTKSITSSFTTGIPDKAFKVSWEPVAGQTVGVGAPISLTFSAPVTDRAAVQRRLAVSADPPVLGAWRWMSDRLVMWRPQEYWAPGTKVHVAANLAGYDSGTGWIGVKDRTMDFTIGAAQVSEVDASTHRMQVYQNGQLVRTMLISGGKPGSLTMEGPHNVLGKAPMVIMDSATVGIPVGSPDYYREEVQWAVHYTSGGQYVHSAPWSVPSQGRANVSHGCVNASPADAEWFYNFSQFGDIINIKNTGRPADTSQLGNEWSVPWATWKAGSALPVDESSDSSTLAGGSSGAGASAGGA
ncbi:Ig-like domain-containing protein [Parafrankia sp. EUN1f]|uniref:L,D-transpeptidase n=1 Tax=Parafrankia sp. EUN1f TaxID=102897 RepID=UPI0001C439D0|nr:Ig-like domain-containing protein [Parafrankia sp. EUN1f]EFC85433.1 ErfK/YbiS/YcfS/YnhG family protein [Parafrankia sp. EUN1f]